MVSPRTFRERRERLGLTQAQVAHRKPSVRAQDVSGVERGVRAPSVTRRVRRALVELELEARRERQEAARERQRRAIWDAIPECDGKTTALKRIEARIVEHYDNLRWEAGDALLDFLSEADARRLLDAYFWEEE